MPLKPLLHVLCLDCTVAFFNQVYIATYPVAARPNFCSTFPSPFSRQATTDLLLFIFQLFLEEVMEFPIHQVV